jgi:circadian clock protein KaiC
MQRAHRDPPAAPYRLTLREGQAIFLRTKCEETSACVPKFGMQHEPLRHRRFSFFASCGYCGEKYIEKRDNRQVRAGGDGLDQEHMAKPAAEEHATSGIAGLDNILRGGFPRNCMLLIAGSPGTGKTTLAMQFLLEGIARGDTCLYVTLSETRSEIENVAISHGWDLSKLHITELVPSERNLSAESLLTVFNPSEIELGETTQALIAAADEHRPQRLVIDSLAELRLIAQNPLRYRRQILALKQYFSGRDCTILLLDDRAGGVEGDHVQTVAHGVILLEQLANQYGAERRRLRVGKMRGVPFRGGFHDFTIHTGGLDVYPRLVASEHPQDFIERDLPSGNAELDALLGGGLPAGTSTLLLGPAGTGKSTMATQFATAGAMRGERAALFIFDENIGTFRSRSKKLGMPVEQTLGNGTLTIQQVDPAELSSGEFIALVRKVVQGGEGVGSPVKLIVIDSLNGYLNAMPEEKFLTAQLHELLAYLGQQGVATILTLTQSGMVGSMTTPIDTTYLADNVVLFRFFEAGGWVRRAISVVKKRNGYHERTIREIDMNEQGLLIGAPLEGFQGVLTGVPTFVGQPGQLLNKH